GQRCLTHAPAKCSREQRENKVKKKRTVGTAGKEADCGWPENIGGMRPTGKRRRDVGLELHLEQQPHRSCQIQQQADDDVSEESLVAGDGFGIEPNKYERTDRQYHANCCQNALGTDQSTWTTRRSQAPACKVQD